MDVPAGLPEPQKTQLRHKTHYNCTGFSMLKLAYSCFSALLQQLAWLAQLPGAYGAGLNRPGSLFISPSSPRTCPPVESTFPTPSLQQNSVVLLLLLFPVFPSASICVVSAPYSFSKIKACRSGFQYKMKRTKTALFKNTITCNFTQQLTLKYKWLFIVFISCKKWNKN